MQEPGRESLSGYQRPAMLLSLACLIFAPPTPAFDSFDLPDARGVPTAYEVGESLRRSLERARPTALAAGDFDEDGVPDLICALAGTSTGYLTLRRGNVDAIFPNAPDARQRRLACIGRLRTMGKNKGSQG